LGQLRESAYFRGKHLASGGRKPLFHQAVDASCHLMERAVVEEMPTLRPRVIPYGLGDQGSDKLLKHRVASLLIFSTLMEEVKRPEQDRGEVKVCCILWRLARAMQGPTLICPKWATKPFSIQGFSFNGGKWLGGLRIQRTVDVAPPLRLREGELEARAAAAGSGVASCVTLAFLTTLVDAGWWSVLVLLLLRGTAMAMSLMDGLRVDDGLMDVSDAKKRNVAWLSAPSLNWNIAAEGHYKLERRRFRRVAQHNHHRFSYKLGFRGTRPCSTFWYHFHVDMFRIAKVEFWPERSDTRRSASHLWRPERLVRGYE
jgi:hypothetical protein